MRQGRDAFRLLDLGGFRVSDKIRRQSSGWFWGVGAESHDARGDAQVIRSTSADGGVMLPKEPMR